jgi:hypothetical protein
MKEAHHDSWNQALVNEKLEQCRANVAKKFSYAL